jgi:hypothetical protein
MDKPNYISEAAMAAINSAYRRQQKWMIYDPREYPLDNHSVYFTKTEEEAREFVALNFTGIEYLKMFHYESIKDAIQQVSTGQISDHQLAHSESFQNILRGIDSGKCWFVFQAEKPFIEPQNVNQFETKSKAIQFIIESDNLNKQTIKYLPSLPELFRQIPFFETLYKISSSLNNTVMNQENLKFLQDRLFYLGTEKRLHPELEKNIAEGKPEFKLSFSNHYDKDKLSAELHFRRSDTNEMYFLNKYDATLQKPGQEAKSQTFYLDHGKGVTMKEAYNLLDGRSVNKDLKNKEGEVKNAWIKLDFTSKEPNGNFKQEQFYKPYGFELHTELFKLPLPQMPAEKFNQMAESLERGNIQKISLPENIIGAVSPINVQANPKFKTLDIMDESGRPLSKAEKVELYALGDQRNKMRDEALSAGKIKGIDPTIHFFDPNMVQATAKNQEQGKDTVRKYKEEKGIPNNDGTAQKVSAKIPKKEKVESLLPKKHNSHKKGLAI